jgi:hypothetical protein
MTKDEIASAMPICTAFARSMREVFGDEVRLTFAEEGGVVLGKPHDLSKHVVASDVTRAKK